MKNDHRRLIVIVVNEVYKEYCAVGINAPLRYGNNNNNQGARRKVGTNQRHWRTVFNASDYYFMYGTTKWINAEIWHAVTQQVLLFFRFFCCCHFASSTSILAACAHGLISITIKLYKEMRVTGESVDCNVRFFIWIKYENENEN